MQVRARRSGTVAAALVAATLGGCVDTTADAGRPDVRAAIARGEVKSPRAATVALSSIEGAPGPVTARFEQAMASEAGTRDIAVTDPGLAHYLVRGYLDAAPTEDGRTTVRYVWDIYDAGKNHARRLDDSLTVAGSAADPWSLVDDQALASLAARSSDDIALFLAGTPEAAGPAGPPPEPSVKP